MYVLKHTGKSFITWCYSKASMIKYPGTIFTDLKMSTIQKTGTSHIITHIPNKKNVLVSKYYNEMKPNVLKVKN